MKQRYYFVNNCLRRLNVSKTKFEDPQSTYWRGNQGVITSAMFDKLRKKNAFKIWHSKDSRRSQLLNFLINKSEIKGLLSL
jgi:hypothetical protein